MQPLPSEMKYSPTLLSTVLSHLSFPHPLITLLPIPEPKTKQAEQRTAPVPLDITNQGYKHVKAVNSG